MLSSKKRLILAGVICYFLFGILAQLPYKLYLRQYINYIPILSTVLNYQSAAGFDQGWNMFAPPPPYILTLKYSLITQTGQTLAEKPFQQLGNKLMASFPFLPPGLIRPMKFLAVRFLINEPKKLKMEKFYYHQMSEYFCSGWGSIPGIIKVRFYIEKRNIPPFYPTDKSGFLKKPEKEGLGLIYERDCREK